MLHYNNYTSNSDTSRFAIPAQGKIRAGYFKGFDTLVDNLGGDSRKILEHQGIDPFVFDDADNDIECGAAVDLLEYASRQLKAPLFGLQLAEQQDPDVFGCVMALARAAPNLRQALQCLIDYVPVSASPECELEMVSSRQSVEFRWRAQNGLGGTEQVSYHGVVLMMKTLKMLGTQHFHPRCASIALSLNRQDTKLLEERLGCRVNGKASANSITFPLEMLDRPVASSNRTLYTLLSDGLMQLRAASKSSFIEQVEANVRRSILEGNSILEGRRILEGHGCLQGHSISQEHSILRGHGILRGHSALDYCAKRMRISARTIQKRLQANAVKFADIVQAERVKLAKHSLRWSDLSLDEIASQLGYAEQTSFGRAFKRATGLTPKEFRVLRDS